jgi:hypothetical protein
MPQRGVLLLSQLVTGVADQRRAGLLVAVHASLHRVIHNARHDVLFGDRAMTAGAGDLGGDVRGVAEGDEVGQLVDAPRGDGERCDRGVACLAGGGSREPGSDRLRRRRMAACAGELQRRVFLVTELLRRGLQRYGSEKATSESE